MLKKKTIFNQYAGKTDPAFPGLAIYPVNKRNIHDLELMVQEQAEYHDCTYKGKRKKLLRDIKNTKRRSALPKAFIVYDTKTQKPAGYVLYTLAWSDKGRIAYLEDICVAEEFRRGRGVGKFAFQELLAHAKKEKCYAVTWSVMKNNTGSIRFYEKQGSYTVPNLNYDLNPMLDQQTADQALPRHPDYRTQLVRSGKLLRELEQHPCVNVSFLKRLAKDPHAQLFITRRKKDRSIVAAMIMNGNYSSFRTVTGIQLKPISFVSSALSDSDKKAILQTTLHHIVEFARRRKMTGHICAYANPNDTVSTNLYKQIGDGLLQMNNDPTSVFQTMEINKGLKHNPDLQLFKKSAQNCRPN